MSVTLPHTCTYHMGTARMKDTEEEGKKRQVIIEKSPNGQIIAWA